MAITLTANLAARLGLVRSLDATEVPSAGAHTTTHNEFDFTKLLNASSTPAGTKSFVNEFTGTQTGLDLTALTDPELGTVDGTDLEVQAILVNNLSATETLTISDNAATPYSLNATANLVVPPGGTLFLYFANGLVDIDATHKLLDFTITAAHSFELGIIMG
ncbi:MAG: hypothetical protein ACYSWU_01925 [Planctomycetota bacterium]|jgi:hypothetical protein